MPEYTKDAVYRELVQICANAGVAVEYGDLPEETAGRSMTHMNLIEMPDQDIFPDNQTAGEVLGHELAHVLFETLPGCMDDEETEADKIGVALYLLAELTAINKAEAVLKNA
jgi:hypothetical protein